MHLVFPAGLLIPWVVCFLSFFFSSSPFVRPPLTHAVALRPAVDGLVPRPAAVLLRAALGRRRVARARLDQVLEHHPPGRHQRHLVRLAALALHHLSSTTVRTRIDIYNAHIGQYDKALKGILLIGNKLRLAILVIGNIYRHIGNRRKARLQWMKMHSCSAFSTIFNGRLSSATKNSLIFRLLFSILAIYDVGGTIVSR